MVEIPKMYGKTLGDPWKESFAKEYCEIIQNIFFPNGISNDTPPIEKVVPVAFLLYTNAHPEFRDFMAKKGTWELLNSLTREHLYVFSIRPGANQDTLNETQEEGMFQLLQVFEIDGIPLNPYLVICDFKLTHRTGSAPWEHIYDARIESCSTFKIENQKPENYVQLIRNTIGKAISENIGYEKYTYPGKTLASAISQTTFKNSVKSSVDVLFKENFSKKFAAAWTMMSWRPTLIR